MKKHTYYFTLSITEGVSTFTGYKIKSLLTDEEARLQLGHLVPGTIMVQSNEPLDIIELPEKEETIQLIPDAI